MNRDETITLVSGFDPEQVTENKTKKHHNGEICLSLKESFVTEIKVSYLEFVIVIYSLL